MMLCSRIKNLAVKLGLVRQPMPPQTINIAAMGREQFEEYVDRLPANCRLFTPKETDIFRFISDLKRRGLIFCWGKKLIPNRNLEEYFANKTWTNTPYFFYFIKAVHNVIPRTAVDLNVSLDLLECKHYLGERYAHFLPADQARIAQWIILNVSKSIRQHTFS